MEGKMGEEAYNVGGKQETVSNECEIEDGNFEDTKVETSDRNSEKSEISDIKKETNLTNGIYNIFPDIYFLSHICSSSMKLIYKINFFLFTFPSLILGINIHTVTH